MHNTELSGICRKAEAWRSQTTFEANVRGRAAPGLNGLLGGVQAYWKKNSTLVGEPCIPVCPDESPNGPHGKFYTG